MIKITDENRSDLIASCLMEAAEIMTESYGKHGLIERINKNNYDKTMDPSYVNKMKKTLQNLNSNIGNSLSEKDIDDSIDISRDILKDNYDNSHNYRHNGIKKNVKKNGTICKKGTIDKLMGDQIDLYQRLKEKILEIYIGKLTIEQKKLWVNQ